MKETELIRKLKESDEQAFKLLYKYFPKIKSHLIGFGATKQQVEDIHHEALFILINKLKDPQFQLTSSVNTFLFGICKNKCISLNREKKKDSDLLHKEEVSKAVETAIQEDQKFQLAQLTQLAFNRLEESCRKLLKAF